MIEYKIEWVMSVPPVPQQLWECRDKRPVRSVLTFSKGATVAEAWAIVEALENLARKREKFEAKEN